MRGNRCAGVQLMQFGRVQHLLPDQLGRGRGGLARQRGGILHGREFSLEQRAFRIPVLDHARQGARRVLGGPGVAREVEDILPGLLLRLVVEESHHHAARQGLAVDYRGGLDEGGRVGGQGQAHQDGGGQGPISPLPAFR